MWASREGHADVVKLLLKVRNYKITRVYHT
jgi:hypothetical protein